MVTLTHRLQVERRTAKERWPETNVLPLSHADQPVVMANKVIHYTSSVITRRSSRLYGLRRLAVSSLGNQAHQWDRQKDSVEGWKKYGLMRMVCVAMVARSGHKPVGDKTTDGKQLADVIDAGLADNVEVEPSNANHRTSHMYSCIRSVCM